MSYSEALSEFSDSEIYYTKPVELKAKHQELWNREPTDKRIVLRANSMLPQLKLASEFLESLWSFSSQPKGGLTGIGAGYKNQGSGFLSIRVTESHWLARGESLPLADYLTYLSPQFYAPNSSSLHPNPKYFDKIKRSIGRRVNRLKVIEPIDLCRCCIAFSCDEDYQKLLFKCVLFFPAVTLQFTPIKPLRLVTCSLSNQLVEGKSHFEYGYLTMDQSRRLFPLSLEDTKEYPLVGVWVVGIPNHRKTYARYNPLSHPLVWASCVQFLECQTPLKKLSPDPQNNTFLLVNFSKKPKFYEVETKGNPSWRTVSFASEAPKQYSYFPPSFVKFQLEDSNSPEISISSPQWFSEDSKRRTFSTATSSKKDLDSFEPLCIDLLEEQSRKFKELQNQLEQIQNQIKSTTSLREHKRLISTGTNTSFRYPEGIRLKTKIPGKLKKTLKPFGTQTPRVSLSSNFTTHIGYPFRNSTESVETTFYVPKIDYNSESESFEEDDEVQILQQKYLP